MNKHVINIFLASGKSSGIKMRKSAVIFQPLKGLEK